MFFYFLVELQLLFQMYKNKKPHQINDGVFNLLTN